MMVGTATSTPWWAWAWPLLASMTLALQLVGHGNVFITVLEAFALIATVFAAVYHAEVVAHKIGEPFGSLVLALAVTIIEVALIVSVMITGIGDSSGLARDTIFAAVMIVCNGIVGICLFGGGVRHKEQDFQLQGAKAALSVLIALTALSLVLPNVTTTTAVSVFSADESGWGSGLATV
jgi:Ca2+:H+ antiporter